MFPWIRRTVAEPHIGNPSPLLTHLAGEFAPRVAGLWPQPHAVFLTAPAERRHLLCLAMALDKDSAGVPAEMILCAPLNQAARAAAPRAPAGLLRALHRMGEEAWCGQDYRALLNRLAHRHASKVLRHAKVIHPSAVRALASLPEPLLRGGVGGLGLQVEQGRLLAECLHAIRSRDGDQIARAAAQRWSAASSPKGLFELVRDDLMPEIPRAPFPGTSRLRPLHSKQAMREAAARYENCLRGEIPDAVDGCSAYYEWLEGPGAVVEIFQDRVFGWRLHQVRLAKNRAVEEPLRSAIIAEVREMGVHVGRTAWQLEEALDDAAEKPGFAFEPEEKAIDFFFSA